MPIPAADLDQLTALMDVKHNMRDILAAVDFDQLIPLPPLPADDATLRVCEALFARYVASGAGALISNDAFDVPKWVFLEHLVKRHGMLVHGSTNPDIAVFEPRASQDNLVGGDMPRVYAASSGVLAGFYAVVDRARLDELTVVPALNNLYVPRRGPRGDLIERFQFALDYRALPHFPWRTGTVYILSRDTFTADHDGEQWFSEQPVRPSAKVSLAPEEWPLLHQVRGVDFIAMLRRFEQGLAGMPWWGDPAIYPADGSARQTAR